MNRREFQELVDKAAVIPAEPYPIENWWDLFHGIGLKSEREDRGITYDRPLFVDEEAAKSFIRYQALQFDGNWDLVELHELAYLFRYYISIISSPKAEKGQPKGVRCIRLNLN